jgi:hypothetical protein
MARRARLAALRDNLQKTKHNPMICSFVRKVDTEPLDSSSRLIFMHPPINPRLFSMRDPKDSDHEALSPFCFFTSPYLKSKGYSVEVFDSTFAFDKIFSPVSGWASPVSWASIRT